MGVGGLGGLPEAILNYVGSKIDVAAMLQHVLQQDGRQDRHVGIKGAKMSQDTADVVSKLSKDGILGSQSGVFKPISYNVACFLAPYW